MFVIADGVKQSLEFVSKLQDYFGKKRFAMTIMTFLEQIHNWRLDFQINLRLVDITNET